ncbi:glycoside hydrolase family 71/99 protein [Streptomyces mayteni]
MSVTQVPGREGRSVLLHDASGTAAITMSRTFASQERAVTVEWQWKESQAGRRSGAKLGNGAAVVVDIATRDESGTKQLVYRTADGTWSVIQTIGDDTWYTVKVTADPAPPAGEAPWVDIFVDGIRKVMHVPFRTATTALDTLTFSTDANSTGDLHVDGVSVKITESVNCDATTQEIMDREIRYARAAGIDYWAFVYYPQQPLARARELYLASTHRNDVKWCAILDGNFIGNYSANLPHLVSRFGDPNYQKVLGGRPLVYFFNVVPASMVNAMRSASAQAGWQDPYIVVMAWTPESAAEARATTGADAVSRYATGGTNGQPYADLATSESGLWPQYAQAADYVVPTVSTGWDKRPRFDYPIPHYSGFREEWVQQATPRQIADHLRDAVVWCGTNPASVPANTVLVYAWNEFDEGGWICPTLFEMRGAGKPLRLDAISKVPRGV